jgi:hypothetical protein
MLFYNITGIYFFVNTQNEKFRHEVRNTIHLLEGWPDTSWNKTCLNRNRIVELVYYTIVTL